MAVKDALRSESLAPTTSRSGGGFMGSWWVLGGAALLMLVALSWPFLTDPTLSAPTRDPAWYTWRAQVILEDEPASVAAEWGPDDLFSGGYRVTVPLAGALLQRVAGIDRYSFSAFLMIGIPVLTGLALGAGAYRSRRDPLVVLMTLLAAVALFLTTPYVGYLDNITVLFLLSLMLPFLHAARTSWGARTALFLIGVAAAFTHPTTCVIFGVVLMAVFGFHFLTSRFSFGAALRADGPMLMSVGFGMIAGLAMWLIGIWGVRASLAEAALPPPYTAAFFKNRLVEWIASMQPLVIVPFILVAIIQTILLSRRERRPANTYDQAAIWWLLPFLGTLTFLSGQAIPYYRFMNSSAAPMALVGLGAFVAIRWFLRRSGAAKIAGALAAALVVASLGWVLWDGLVHRWATPERQWANQQVRASLAAVHEIVDEAGDRPVVLVMNYVDKNDPYGTNTAYGWAKTFTNVFRTGLAGPDVKQQVTFLGDVEDFYQGNLGTAGASEGYRDFSSRHAGELRERMEEFPEPPVAFLIGQYYADGLCNGVEDCDAKDREALLDRALEGSIEVGPDVYVLTGATGETPLYEPSPEAVDRARSVSAAEAERFADHPGILADPLHTVLVVLGLMALVVVPGLLAAPWFGLDDRPSKLALIPGMGIVITLLSGIAVLAVWRGSLTTTKAWVIALVAIGVGAALRAGHAWLERPLDAFSGFFNRMFAVFSNRDFATLMGVQFLVMAGDGLVRGSIAKSIAFGGQEGFDVTTVPSATYLLEVVLALYVPYTLLSPFIGVFIDRLERRRVLWWANLASAALISVIALSVLVPLGKGTSEGRVGVTAALILGMLAMQAAVRIMLAVKSAALPDVLSGKDLLQGNGLSQAGGALFQVLGAGFAFGAGVFLPSWLIVIMGVATLVLGAIVALRIQHMQVRPHESTFVQEAGRVLSDIWAGLKEVVDRPAAALGLSSFQMLRYQFWGFVLFTFALYARSLVTTGDADTLALALVGGGGFLGGAIGMVLAEKWKDRVPPVRLLLASMLLLGIGTLIFGSMVSLAGFAALLFVGFFTFFLGKISADTITQQAMPDDFRGRAFALFDIAYNLGFIVPALILSVVWTDEASQVRTILMVSGALFIVLTFLVGAWARRIRDQFAPQDDLVGEELAELTASTEA